MCLECAPRGGQPYRPPGVHRFPRPHRLVPSLRVGRERVRHSSKPWTHGAMVHPLRKEAAESPPYACGALWRARPLALAFKLPTTIEYRRPKAADRLRFSVTSLPIEPRLRVAGATWSPRRFLADFPALLDDHDLDVWLAWAAPGTKVAYHLGLSLGAERSQDEALDLLARAVLVRAHTTTLGVTAPPCGHLWARWLGSADFEPQQRRLPDGRWLYLVVRR